MSPKSRTALTKKQEKSPVLNVRKNNSINSALKANQATNQAQSETHTQKKNLAHKTQSPPPSLPSAKQHISHAVTPDNMSNESSDDDSDHFSADKLKTIRNKAAQR